jgi:hypothetical protein
MEAHLAAVTSGPNEKFLWSRNLEEKCVISGTYHVHSKEKELIAVDEIGKADCTPPFIPED